MAGMHRGGAYRASVLMTVAAGFFASASMVAAETIPLPKPAPHSRSAAPRQMAQAMPSSPAQAASPGNTVGGFLGGLFGGSKGATSPNPGTSPGTFDANQRALVDKISAYLSGVQTMVGKFVQVGPDGRRTEGQLYIQKPGKVRFEYADPSPIAIVADGQSVIVRDRKLATQDVYPLSQTPLRYLLADRIDLMRDTKITGVYADDVFATIVIEERQPVVGNTKLMMMFGAKDLQLRQWTVTDPQGYDTTVAVYNLDTSKKPDPNLFKIDYTVFKN